MKTYVICSALIINKGRFLIARRSPGKTFAPGEWELISGFIDKEKATVEKIMLEELEEELNIAGKIVKSGHPFVQRDRYGRWVVVPFIIRTDAKGLRINDRDHTELKWITKSQLSEYKNLNWFIKGFKESGML